MLIHVTSVLTVLTMALALGACATGPLLTCLPGETPAVLDTAYFGTAETTRAVTMTEWREFIDSVVTPRFQDGLTSWQASGQWRSAGVVKREVSHILRIVHPDDERSELAFREIISRYKARFQQETVLRVRSLSCMSL